MKIAITPRGFANYGLDAVKEMESKGYEVAYNNTGKAFTPEQFYQFTDGADGVIVGVEKVDKAYIDAHPTLKAVVKFGVGTDNIDIPYCTEKNIFVGRTVGSNSRSVAETAMSYMLADSKNLYESITITRENGWTKLNGYEVKAKTVGVLGFGSVGKEISRMAKGLSMNVLAYDAYPIDPKVAEEIGAKITTFDDVIENSDFITLHLPLTEETKNIINLDVMKRMKKTAVLINTSRGGVVDENQLYEALSTGIIKAAYFDVFTSEPPLAGEKLLTLKNFYLTPHIASRSAEAEINTVKISTKVITEALEKK